MKIALTNAPKLITESMEKKKIMETFHDDPIRGGHSGIKRTQMKIKQFYTWKDLSKEVHKYVKSCIHCQQNKIGRKHQADLCKTLTPQRAFDVVQIDTKGRLPRTINNNEYIVTMICDLTKYLIAVPTKSKDAKTIAKTIFEKLILIYGTPKTILTDCGTEFKNNVLSELTKLLGVEHNFSTPYHHQTLGTVERSHRTLNEYLRSYMDANTDTWDEWIPCFTYCYNTTPSTSHNYTPFEMIFGRQAPNFDTLSTEIEPIYNFDSYVKELKFRLQCARQRAINMQERMKSERKRRYDDEREIKYNFSTGDLVLVHDSTNHKFEKLYNGPFEVVSVSDFDCVLRNENQNEFEIHKDRLKPYDQRID